MLLDSHCLQVKGIITNLDLGEVDEAAFVEQLSSSTTNNQVNYSLTYWLSPLPLHCFFTHLGKLHCAPVSVDNKEKCSSQGGLHYYKVCSFHVCVFVFIFLTPICVYFVCCVFRTTDEFLAGLSDGRLDMCRYEKELMAADLLQAEELTDLQAAMDFCASVADAEGEQWYKPASVSIAV